MGQMALGFDYSFSGVLLVRSQLRYQRLTKCREALVPAAAMPIFVVTISVPSVLWMMPAPAKIWLEFPNPAYPRAGIVGFNIARRGIRGWCNDAAGGNGQKDTTHNDR